MKSAEQIEQSIKRLNIQSGAERRERTLHDLAKAHAQEKNPPARSRWSFRRTMMTHGKRRLAAVAALVIVLVGTFSLSTGSAAFSQAGHAVNSTLARLRAMIVGADQMVEPEAANLPDEGGSRPPNLDRRAIRCAARFFLVPTKDRSIWQSLREQGIDLVQASTNPPVYYAALTRGQSEAFDAAVTLRCLCAPRLTVSEGESGTIAITQDKHGLALAWLPVISSDGTEILSTLSFHDGRDGFELSNIGTESGGAVLIRMNGVVTGLAADGPDGEDRQDALIRVQIDLE